MKWIWQNIKKHYELMAYCVLVALFLGACFSPIFAWIVTIYVVLLAIILYDETKLIGLMLFIYCFYVLIAYQKNSSLMVYGEGLYSTLTTFIRLRIFFTFLIRVVRREQKINWKIIVPLGLFLVYMALPLHECNLESFINELLFWGLLYIVFEKRKSIDFCYLVRIFVAGLIISSCLAMLRDVSPLLKRLSSGGYYYNSFRPSGLTEHINVFASMTMIAICALLILKFKNKISSVEFFVGFVPLFILGYLTISRSFIITVAIGIAIFIIFYIFQRKVESLTFVSILLTIICITSIVFNGATWGYLKRFATETYDVDFKAEYFKEFFYDQPVEWRQDVLEGKVRFDPSRQGIYYLYFTDWTSSPQNILFGRGIARPWIGVHFAAHNIFLQELWEHGLIGCIFYFIIILSIIDWKKFKYWQKHLSSLIIILPYLALRLVEPCINDYLKITLVICAVGFIEQSISSGQDKNPNTQLKSILIKDKTKSHKYFVCKTD